MQTMAEKQRDEIKQKLEYIGLDLEKIPTHIKKFKPLGFKVPKFHHENKFKQYRYLPIKDIQILLSPTNRLDELEEKYKQATPLIEYLEGNIEENKEKYATFLTMLQQVNRQDIEKIEIEQENLSRTIPFNVKYEGNYLWQIYYAEETEQYFMIVSTKELDNASFFYLLKKQLERGRKGEIFVPVSHIEYSKTYLRKSEFEDLENYLWMFTKHWPLIYEVYHKDEKLSIQITGETYVYEKIKSSYKIELKTKASAKKLHKLLKAMFILQTELPHYYEFKTNIGKTGDLQFTVRGKRMQYEKMAEFIKEEFLLGEERKEKTLIRIKNATNKLEELKQLSAMQELEYLEKEKQISTFLECKKTFFGKFKYFFKYSKKNKSNVIRADETEVENLRPEKKQRRNDKALRKEEIKENYTLEELIDSYKELEDIENEFKSIVMDINALKLKTKNMAKKIENAAIYIQEIDKHKKSIFEFWKYSNKDEMAVLPEGEEEEIGIIKKISKVFDYEEDLEEFGRKLDSYQRKTFTKEETDNIYILTTNLIEIINKIKTGEATPKDIEASLKQIKKEKKEELSAHEEEFDIFGGMIEESTKIQKIKDKKHRELPKDKSNILELTSGTKAIGYKLRLEQVLEELKNAFEKAKIVEEIPIYKAMLETKMNRKSVQIYNINPEEELKDALSKNKKIYFYKIALKEGSKAIGFTNSIFYDNQNRTLPIGMDLSTNVAIDLTKLPIELKRKRSFKVLKMEEENNDFSDISVQTIYVLEYEIKEDGEEKETQKRRRKNIETKGKLKNKALKQK